MSELLRGYEEHVYRIPAHRDLIENAIFVFDANILLNIYRWKRQTFDDFVSCLEKIGSSSVCITSQIQQEFFRNRVQHALAFTRLNHLGSDLADAARNRCKSEFDQNTRGDLKEELMKSLETAFSDLAKSVNQIIKKEFQDKLSLLVEDPLLERLSRVVTTVTAPFDESARKVLEKDADQQRLRIIADKNQDIEKFPGFSDHGKGYGDYIIFHELLELAKQKNKDIVFVTDEKKDDWFYKVHGRIEAVRLNVRRKFVEISRVIDIWGSLEFIERIAQGKDIKLGKETVSDVARVAQETQTAPLLEAQLPAEEDSEGVVEKISLPPEDAQLPDEGAPLPPDEDHIADIIDESQVKSTIKTEGKGV